MTVVPALKLAGEITVNSTTRNARHPSVYELSSSVRAFVSSTVAHTLCSRNKVLMVRPNLGTRVNWHVNRGTSTQIARS